MKSAHTMIIGVLGCVALSLPSSAYSVDDFLGEWNCSYETTASPEQIRHAEREITEAGIVVQRGLYTAGHSTGYIGPYLSVAKFEVTENTVIETLLDYEFMGEYGDGTPMSELERNAFEEQVETARPVVSVILELSQTTHTIKSQFAEIGCQRKTENVS
ncbi:MAG: hypothetical protein CMK09_16880 [Ponticaulis sp.]|nr:hypothetical protein [Ponticaulis sp.]|tara:strand:- start:35570 stop:36046 length:477 start_codon:yes stop_codon:yes gene_type:complete